MFNEEGSILDNLMIHFYIIKSPYLKKLKKSSTKAQSTLLHLAPEQNVIDLAVSGFYEAVDTKFSTYCSVGARVMQAALQHFGISGELMPCQLMAIRGTKAHLVGFLGQQHPGAWDGHVVYATESLLVDTAVTHLRRDFDLNVPMVITAKRMPFPSRVYASSIFDSSVVLLWVAPPQGFDPTPPDEPSEVVQSQAHALIDHIKAKLRAAPSE